MNYLNIEDIILSHDRRGISSLRSYLSPAYCNEAARFILDKTGTKNMPIVITTGFFILKAKSPETDGPPGAVALGKALNKLGLDVFYVTDRYATMLLTIDDINYDRVIEFPLTDHKKSQDLARRLLSELKPSLLITIERCGLSNRQRYLNMAGKDISRNTAKIDYLFSDHEATIGIGDGGNEIGMGNLATQIKEQDKLPDEPSLTQVTKLVIASVSNWGAYGILTALSQLVNQNLVPSVEWEKEIIEEIVMRGAVDGVTGERKCAVDGFNLEQNAWALTQLTLLLRKLVT